MLIAMVEYTPRNPNSVGNTPVGQGQGAKAHLTPGTRLKNHVNRGMFISYPGKVTIYMQRDGCPSQCLAYCPRYRGTDSMPGHVPVILRPFRRRGRDIPTGTVDVRVDMTPNPCKCA